MYICCNVGESDFDLKTVSTTQSQNKIMTLLSKDGNGLGKPQLWQVV